MGDTLKGVAHTQEMLPAQEGARPTTRSTAFWCVGVGGTGRYCERPTSIIIGKRGGSDITGVGDIASGAGAQCGDAMLDTGNGHLLPFPFSEHVTCICI